MCKILLLSFSYIFYFFSESKNLKVNNIGGAFITPHILLLFSIFSIILFYSSNSLYGLKEKTDDIKVFGLALGHWLAN